MNRSKLIDAGNTVSNVLVVILAALGVVIAVLVGAYFSGQSAADVEAGAETFGVIMLAVALAITASVDAVPRRSPEADSEEGGSRSVADYLRLGSAGLSVAGATLVVVATLIGHEIMTWTS